MDKDIWWVAVKSLFYRRKQLSIVSYISKSKIIRHSWSYKIALEMWPVNGSLRIVYAKRGRQGVNWQDLSHRHSRDGKEITLDIHRGAHKPRAPEFAGSFWPFRCTSLLKNSESFANGFDKYPRRFDTAAQHRVNLLTVLKNMVPLKQESDSKGKEHFLWVSRTDISVKKKPLKRSLKSFSKRMLEAGGNDEQWAKVKNKATRSDTKWGENWWW